LISLELQRPATQRHVSIGLLEETACDRPEDGILL